MAITKPPKPTAKKSVDDFIDNAPDSSSSEINEKTEKPKGVKVGSKLQITTTLTPDLLAKVEKKAKDLGIPRASFISMALSKAVE